MGVGTSKNKHEGAYMRNYGIYKNGYRVGVASGKRRAVEFLKAELKGESPLLTCWSTLTSGEIVVNVKHSNHYAIQELKGDL